MKRFVTGLMILGLLVGCSSKRIETVYSETAGFSRFKTFQYQDNGFTVESANPLVHTRIVEALAEFPPR